MRSYICNLIESVRDDNHMYIVMECLGGGELFEQLLAKGPFKEDYALAIFAQVAIACDYMHGLNVVHRDLKAENLVFAAKGSPVIKFIDFGGASVWSPDEGLTGLVGTPQYVAPEVVTGFGENNPTNEAYGKGCDLWSMGVLLYVMLSKTMPFRAKEVDQLLKQVVKGKFKFTPEDRWRHISPEAKDLITGLLTRDPKQRLTIQQVKEHPWAADAIRRTLETMPKMVEEVKKEAESRGSSSTKSAFTPLLSRMKSAASKGKKGANLIGRPKNKGVSREQEYWYAMEISPPTDMKKGAGVKLGADGKFELDGDMPEEMRKMLEEIEKQKAAKAAGGAATSSAPQFVRMASSDVPPPPPNVPPPPPGGGGAPPPPSGPPPDVSDDAHAGLQAQMSRLTTEQEASIRAQGTEMDTL
jgi:serine/threonine protein kinase